MDEQEQDVFTTTLDDFLARSDRSDQRRKASLQRYEQDMFKSNKPLYNTAAVDDENEETPTVGKAYLRARRTSLFG